MATGSQKNIALIGCGARGRSYLENLKNGFKGGWQLSAIADTDREALEKTKADYGDGKTLLFEDFKILYEKQGCQCRRIPPEDIFIEMHI